MYQSSNKSILSQDKIMLTCNAEILIFCCNKKDISMDSLKIQCTNNQEKAHCSWHGQTWVRRITNFSPPTVDVQWCNWSLKFLVTYNPKIMNHLQCIISAIFMYNLHIFKIIKSIFRSDNKTRFRNKWQDKQLTNCTI